jgi:hypothetical protein
VAGAPLVQEFGEFKRRIRAFVELSFDGAPVLDQYFPPGGGRERASLDIEQQIDFPALKAVAGDARASEIVHEPAELVEHRLLIAA